MKTISLILVYLFFSVVVPMPRWDERYRVGKVLGKGGFGTVYSGWRMSDGAPIAIKQIARNKITNFEYVSILKVWTLSAM